jgi:hypothetical protein
MISGIRILALSPFGSLALAAVLLAGVSPANARADLVPPRPRSCPQGSEPGTSHAGGFCGPGACTSGDCPLGTRCEKVKGCVTRLLGNSRGGPFSVEHVLGPCGKSDTCADGGACMTWSACVEGSDTKPPPASTTAEPASERTSRCNCDLSPASLRRDAASVTGLALAALGLASRRRRARG